MLHMRAKASIVITLFVLQCLATLGASKDFDFFYFVQQWPASYCDTKQGCCYPTHVAEYDEDFTIYGLWPTYNSSKRAKNCNNSNALDLSQISDLIGRLQKDWPSFACPSSNATKFWRHAWKKFGTCSNLDQHSYFQAALELKYKANLLQALKSAGVEPGDSFYSLERIKEAIQFEAGVEPYIQCNTDVAGNKQIYQVYLCVDKSASNFIECPIFPRGEKCSTKIEFPSSPSEPKSLGVVQTELLVTSY